MLQLLTRIIREKPFQYVKMGREKGHGIVLGVEHGRWVLDSDSNILMIQGDAVFDRIIVKTIEYLAQISNHHETLIFEDHDGQIVEQFGNRLVELGYHILKIDLADSLNIDALYLEALQTPTAIMVSPSCWSEFMRNLIIYTIERCADSVLPSPVTIILSHETAADGTLSISRAVHRNIFFVVKSSPSNKCKKWDSIICRYDYKMQTRKQDGCYFETRTSTH